MPPFFFCRRKKQRHASWERRQATTPRAAAVIAGRRYLTEVPYALPKDTDEVNRLDFQHSIYRQVLRGNFLVPLQNPRMILDVACGTGFWCKEMATQFPGAKVFGLDIENIRESGDLPVKYQFVQGNILEELPFADHTFDFVYQRFILALTIPFKRWVWVFRELLRVTHPGGWLELPEVGVEVLNMGPLTRQFFEWGINASEPRGLSPRQIQYVDRYLLEAGAHNVGVQYRDVPMGARGGRIGKLMGKNLEAVLPALKGLYCERGATEEDFKELHRQLFDEWSTYRSKMRFFIFSCQK